MTNLEVAFAGLILLSLTSLLAIIGEKTSRLRFLLFAGTCLTYLCFLIWNEPKSINSRNSVIVFMAIIWAIFETLEEEVLPQENQNYDGGFRFPFFLRVVSTIFLATAPILLVIVDHEKTEFGYAEWFAVATWTLGALFKISMRLQNIIDFKNIGSYLMVWSYYIYALGTHDGIFAIFAPILILGKIVKAPEFFRIQRYSANVK